MRVIAALTVALVAVVICTPAHGQGGGAKGAAEGPPAGWERTRKEVRDLQFAGNEIKAIAIMERIVADHPGFAEGHARLGGAHEGAARALAPTNPAAARRHFEMAATHLRHAFERGGGEYPDATIRGLIDLYEYALPDPQKWKATVREALERYPAEPAAHWYNVQLILQEDRISDLGVAFRTARAAVPPAADPRLEYASLLISRAEKESGSAARTLIVREALAIADEVVKNNSTDRNVRTKADAIRKDAARLPVK